MMRPLASRNAEFSSAKVAKPAACYLAGGLIVVLSLVFAVASGRAVPHTVADTASYRDYPLGDLDAALRHIRTPGYPLLMSLARRVGMESGIPLFQMLLFAVAGVALMRELHRWGMPLGLAWAAGLTLPFGCTAWDHVSTLATDAPAAALSVLCVAACMAWCRGGYQWQAATVLIGLVTLVISLRPAYLFLPAWIGVTGLLLSRYLQRDWHASVLRPLGLAILCGLPVLAWTMVRGAVVGHYGVVAFGSQNLAGVLVQIVDEAVLMDLSEDSVRFARRMREHRDRWYAAHPEPPMDDRAYMTWENRWHDVTYHAVVPAAAELYGHDPLQVHLALQRFNREVLRRAPQAYAIWWMKAYRRAVWGAVADIAMHPLMLVFLTMAGGVWMLRVVKGKEVLGREVHKLEADATEVPGLTPLLVVALTLALMKAAFVVLSSPAIGRFIDAGAILLPACLIVPLSRWMFPRPWSWWRRFSVE